MSDFTDFGDLLAAGEAPQQLKNITFEDSSNLIVQEIRSGGMGNVFIGELILPGDQQMAVAAKSVKEQLLLNASALMAFRNEMSIWSRLSDLPFIHPLFSIKRSKGFYFAISPFVEPDENGVVNLRDLLKHFPEGLPEERLFTVAFTIASGMVYGQQVVSGLVHGDIKPENLFMRGHFAFLNDFGIAKCLNSIDLGDLARGSQDYLAPELKMDPSAFSVRSDLFAYGRVLYECLYGRLPAREKPGSLSSWFGFRKKGVEFPASSAHSVAVNALKKLIRSCLAEQPDLRPSTFKEVLEALLPIGLEHYPNVIMQVSSFTAYLREMQAEHAPFFLKTKVNQLIDNGDFEHAAHLLQELPEELEDVDMLTKAARVFSELRDFAQAFRLIDKALALDAESWLQFNARIEKGIILRKADRLEESLAIFEQLMENADQEEMVIVRSNYVSTLMVAGQAEKARKHAKWLTIQQQQNSDFWTLLGQAEKMLGNYVEAANHLQRAVHLDQNNHLAQLDLGEIVLTEFGDPARALHHLDLSYNSGHHPIDLLVHLYAANFLLGEMDDAQGLLQSLLKNDSEAAMQVLRSGQTLVNQFVDRFVEENAPSTPTQETTSRPGSAGMPSVLEMPMLLEEGQEKPLITFRGDLNSEYYTIDFYSSPEDPDYARDFARGFAAINRLIIPEYGIFQLQNTVLGMMKCDHCGCHILSNRREQDRIRCQDCQTKVTVRFLDPPIFAPLIEQCEKSAELVRSKHQDVFVLLAFWLSDNEQHQRVQAIAADGGWKSIATSGPSGNLSAILTQMMGHDIQGNPALLLLKFIPDGEPYYSQTPWTVQEIILAVYREIGRSTSSSIILSKKFLPHFTANEDELYNLQYEALLADHEQAEDLARFIELVSVKDLEEAKSLVALSLQISQKDHPALFRARGVFYLKKGAFQEAEESLLQAKRMDPLDRLTRLHLTELWTQLGETEKARLENNELLAIGRDFLS